MSRLTPPLPPQDQPEQQQTDRQPTPRRRFRWSPLIAASVTCLAAMWFLRGIEASISFADIASAAGAKEEIRYAMLATLGVVLILLVLAVKSSGRR